MRPDSHESSYKIVHGVAFQGSEISPVFDGTWLFEYHGPGAALCDVAASQCHVGEMHWATPWGLRPMLGWSAGRWGCHVVAKDALATRVVRPRSREDGVPTNAAL